MSAEQIPQPPSGESTPSDVPQLSEAVLIPIRRQAEQRHNREMEFVLDDFRGYTRDLYDVDPLTMQSQDSPRVARAAHTYFVSLLQWRIDALNPPIKDGKQRKVADTPDGPIIALPEKAVTRHIDQYYTRFGTNRRNKPPVTRGLEEEFIKRAQRPLRAVHHVKKYVEKDSELVAVHEARARSAIFLEVDGARRLHALLRKQGHTLAADSVEVVLAAYGQHFTTIFGERGIVVKEKDTGKERVVLEPNAKKHIPILGRTGVVTQFDIPNDPNVKAENFRPRLPRE